MSSDGYPLKTFGSFIWHFFFSYFRLGLRPQTEPLYIVKPGGGCGDSPARPRLLLGSLLLFEERELSCGLFPFGHGGRGGSPELPTQLLLPLPPPLPTPPPSPPLPALLDSGVEGGRETSSAS